MTDKEILAELKKSYEYLSDIRENGCVDHCSGQLNSKIIDMLNIAKRNIEDSYFEFYKTLDRENLRVKSLENNEKVYIARTIDGDYEIGEDSDNLTCIDADYFWYEDQDFLDSEINYDNKYYANLWITENDRKQGYVTRYYKDFVDLKDAIEELRTYFYDGNCVCVEIYDFNDVLQYSCDEESEEFYIDDLKIVKINEDIINKYIDSWSNHKQLPINEKLLYYENDENLFIAIDNTAGNCWTEEFKTETDAQNWLLGKDMEKGDMDIEV